MTNISHGLGRKAAVFTAVFACAAGIGSIITSQVVFSAAPAVAGEKFDDLGPAIDDLRKAGGHYRRDLVKANILVTGSEGAIFWPLYDEYRAERDKITDKRVKLIKDFLAKRDSMTQDDAEELTKESLSLDHDIIDVKEKWAKKMAKDLSQRTVARFFQVDQRLDAVTNIALASRIPLIY
jgi:hypothetical protein